MTQDQKINQLIDLVLRLQLMTKVSSMTAPAPWNKVREELLQLRNRPVID